MAQESPDAHSARTVLPPTAPVIMVHVNELPLLKRLVAHATGVHLRSQQAVELLLSQPVATDAVLPVGLLARHPLRAQGFSRTPVIG
jgi:hypothetical protein